MYWHLTFNILVTFNHQTYFELCPLWFLVFFISSSQFLKARLYYIIQNPCLWNKEWDKTLMECTRKWTLRSKYSSLQRLFFKFIEFSFLLIPIFFSKLISKHSKETLQKTETEYPWGKEGLWKISNKETNSHWKQENA